MTNTINYKKIQWDVALFYLLISLFTGYIFNNVVDDFISLFKNDNIKTEYRIELISNDFIKVYSTSSDTVYKGTTKEFEEIIHMDNL